MNDSKMTTNNIEAEYMDIMNRSAWPLIYQKIFQQCQVYRYTCTHAKKPQNKPLNRYRDVNPYDHSRVILKRTECDYINANLVKMERAGRKYILTQGPLRVTVGHFWLMVWEQDTRAIVMLNKTIEKDEVKCYQYWPIRNGERHKMVLEDVKLVVTQLSEQDFDYYSTRVFSVTDMDSLERRTVIQFHYTTWPDFGVPSSPVAFLDFLRKVRASGALDPDVGPPIVHCSAGIGRSGTFCLVDLCLVIIEKEGFERVNVQEILLEMRKQRMGLIQTSDQLRFSYQAIIEGAKVISEWKDDPPFEPCLEQPSNDTCDLNEETPPPLPCRIESLTRAPARPLPAIPISASVGEFPSLDRIPMNELEESSSDERSITPPNLDLSLNQQSESHSSMVITPISSSILSPMVELRRRRDRELAEHVAATKRQARSSERWQAIKRSFKPITITFGVLLAGVIIYKYVKN